MQVGPSSVNCRLAVENPVDTVILWNGRTHQCRCNTAPWPLPWLNALIIGAEKHEFKLGSRAPHKLYIIYSPSYSSRWRSVKPRRIIEAAVQTQVTPHGVCRLRHILMRRATMSCSMMWHFGHDCKAPEAVGKKPRTTE